MPEALLETRDLAKRYGGLVVTNGVSLSIARDEIHAVIGPNGAGKTTLVAELAGELRPDAGSIRFDGADITGLGVAERVAIGIARSFQITSIFREFSVLDNVALAVQAHAGHSFRFWRPARRDPRLIEPARALLAQVGLDVRAEMRAAALSHGEKRALEIAMVLATEPRLLLLDEPMAGMGPQDAAGMVRLLAGLKRRVAMVLVEHDMDVVFALADRITVLVDGRIIATGSPAAIRGDAAVRRAYLGEAAA
jgi:branched-chain amino acid transport system ATP-binding protein